MIKVVFVISGLENGGAEMMLVKLLSRIDRTLFLPVVISLRGDGPAASYIEALGVPVHKLGMRYNLAIFGCLRRFILLLRALKPDILQGWMYHANLAVLLAAPFVGRNLPVLWNIRASPTKAGRMGLATTFIVWLGGKCSRLPLRIINNSQTSAWLHAILFGYCQQRQHIIPNGFDTAEFAPAATAGQQMRKELGLQPKALLIGLFGRFHPVKGHMDFLHAAAKIRRTHPDVYFVLAGCHIDTSNIPLARLVSKLGLQDRIFLLGHRTDMAHLSAALDILVCASSSEGFANVIGEAMSCATPCIVTDVGDSAFIVGDTGLVVQPEAPEALAAAMQQMIDMGAAGRCRLGQEARQRILQSYEINRIVCRYERLYRAVYRWRRHSCSAANNGGARRAGAARAGAQ